MIYFILTLTPDNPVKCTGNNLTKQSLRSPIVCRPRPAQGP